MHRGEPALALRTQTNGYHLSSAWKHAKLCACEYCRLMQYRTSNSLCRRCHKPLDIEEPAR